MRILHVVKKYPDAIGGDATCVFNLGKQQALAGHKIFILTTNCREIINQPNLFKFGLRSFSHEWDKVSIKRILSLLLLFFVTPAVLRKARPDVIHSHAADLGFVVSLWAKVKKIPIINTCHGITFPHAFFGLQKRIPEWIFLKFAFFDKIITVDRNSLDFFRQYGLKKYIYAPMCGVEEKYLKAPKNFSGSSGGKNTVKFIFVGRLDPFKGLDYLLQAAAKLKETNDNFELWVIGSGPLQKRLLELACNLGLSEKVIFCGAITDREKLFDKYAAADIFVLPSLSEGFPITILEAWSVGLALIATDVCGISFICKDKVNALLVEPGNTHSLYSAMLCLMANPGLGIQLGGKGRLLVEEKYTWGVVSHHLEKVYSSCITTVLT